MRLHLEVPDGNRVFLSQHTFEPQVTSCVLKVRGGRPFCGVDTHCKLARCSLTSWVSSLTTPVISFQFQFVSRHKREELFIHSVQISLEPMTPSPAEPRPCAFPQLVNCRRVLMVHGRVAGSQIIHVTSRHVTYSRRLIHKPKKGC